MVARNRVAWSKGPLKPYEPVPSVTVHGPACGPSRTSTRAPLSGCSALSNTIPASCVVLDGTGCGAGCRAAVGVVDGADGPWPAQAHVKTAKPIEAMAGATRGCLVTT